MRRMLMTGAGAALVIAIMVIGSIVLWAGTPLAWLWIGAQIEGATQSLGAALAAAFAGVIVSILLLASVLARLSDLYRANRVARGLDDPGHVVLEGVLVVSAGISLAAFTIWFFLFAGAAPAPVSIQI
jgi:hypothetical protein